MENFVRRKNQGIPAFAGMTIISIILITGTLLAEGSGGFAGSFLRVGLGARGMAMGNAQVASADNGFGMYYNPAGLSRLEKRQFALSYSSMSLDREFNFIGLSAPLPPFAGAAIGWINSGVGDLSALNSVGENVGEINNGLNAIYGAFSMNMVKLLQMDGLLQNTRDDLITIGIAVKFLREGISDDEEFDYSGSGFGFDFGVMIRPVDQLTIGYQLKDVNASLKSNTNDLFSRGIETENAFPTTQKAGVFFQTPVKNLAIAYDFEWNDKGTEKQHVGAEYLMDIAAIRAGYDTDHLTLGGGLIFHPFKSSSMILDYAFVGDVVDEGVSHIFSWRFLF